MAINKRSEDFTLEDIKQLIKENRELRLENSILKARTHSRDWKGGGFTPNKKDNPLSSRIQYGQHVSEYTAFFQSLSFNRSLSFWLKLVLLNKTILFHFNKHLMVLELQQNVSG